MVAWNFVNKILLYIAPQKMITSRNSTFFNSHTMRNLNVSYFVLTLSILSFLQLSASGSSPPPKCLPGLIVDCRLDHEDIVWATENDNTCNVSVNRCLYNKQYCFRQRNGQSPLKEISKEACQKLCNNSCELGGEQVCASRGNNKCYFPDKCTLDRYICNNAEIWRLELNRFCVEAPSSTCPTF